MVRSFQYLLGALLLSATSVAFGSAPLLKVSKSVTIHAPASVVWNSVKDFNGINKWHPAVETDRLLKGRNNRPGAVRLLTLKGGGTIEEKLLRFSNRQRSFRYRIVKSVLPVSDYHSTLVVRVSGKGESVVTWSGTFKRKDTGPSPAAGADDKTATKTIAGVYESGLENLKKLVERH